MGQEALVFHIHGIIEDGDEIPQPLSIHTVRVDPDMRDATIALFSV